MGSNMERALSEESEISPAVHALQEFANLEILGILELLGSFDSSNY